MFYQKIILKAYQKSHSNPSLEKRNKWIAGVLSGIPVIQIRNEYEEWLNHQVQFVKSVKFKEPELKSMDFFSGVEPFILRCSVKIVKKKSIKFNRKI